MKLLIVISTAVAFAVAFACAEEPKSTDKEQKNDGAQPCQLVRNLEAGKKQHIVTYGTSLTAGAAWVAQMNGRLNKKYPGLVAVTNSGEGGMWSKWGVDNLDERVIKKNPDAVFIEFAINDAFLPYKTTVEQCRKNLETMIDRIQKQNPACQVILMTMNPPINVHLEQRPKVEDYYQVYRDVATARKLLLIDHYRVWKAILDKDKATFDKYVPDGIHPGEDGCTMVITPGIGKALFGK